MALVSNPYVWPLSSARCPTTYHHSVVAFGCIASSAGRWMACMGLAPKAGAAAVRVRLSVTAMRRHLCCIVLTYTAVATA